MEMCGIRSRADKRGACVPFPAPGGPSITNLIYVALVPGTGPLHEDGPVLEADLVDYRLTAFPRCDVRSGNFQPRMRSVITPEDLRSCDLADRANALLKAGLVGPRRAGHLPERLPVNDDDAVSTLVFHHHDALIA